MSEQAGPHLIEIEYRGHGSGGYAVYRFFGHGVWKVKLGDKWAAINAIFVPFDALHTAATQCRVVVPQSAEGLRNDGP